MSTVAAPRLSEEELAEIEASLKDVPPGPYEPSWESCDCGGDYPCSHGSWIDGLRLPIPKQGDKPTAPYAHHYSEISNFSTETAQMFANAEPNIRRLLETVRYWQGQAKATTGLLVKKYPDFGAVIASQAQQVEAQTDRIKALEAEKAAIQEQLDEALRWNEVRASIDAEAAPQG